MPMPADTGALLVDKYSKAVLTLWGEKDEEATKTWMGKSIALPPIPISHEAG